MKLKINEAKQNPSLLYLEEITDTVKLLNNNKS